RVGIIDMSSFGKIELRGPDALPHLERVAGNLIDRPVGSVVYTQLLEKNGGIVADVTITRVSQDRFQLVTGAGFVNSDLGWLRLQASGESPRVGIRETSDELSVIGLWGPDARDVMQRVTVGDVSDSAFPFMTAQPLRIANTNLLAQRVTYVGALGWELYVDPARAGQVWDRLLDAGREFGITPGGYRVLDSLRMEKGYRYYGFSVRKNIAYSYQPVELKPGEQVDVEVFGQMVPAVVTQHAVRAKHELKQRAS